MSVRGSEQAVVTDFDEAFGQDVLKEATDNLFGGNGRESGPICGRVLVGECDQAIFEREDAAIADGDAKDVRSEVFEGGGACAYRLRVNDPIFAPNLRVKEPEEIGILMVVVAAAVASATFKLQFLGVLLAMSFAALELQRQLTRRADPRHARHLVTVVVPNTPDPASRSAINALVARHLGGGRLESVTSRADAVIVSFSYAGRHGPDLEALRGDLESQSAGNVSIQLARARQ